MKRIINFFSLVLSFQIVAQCMQSMSIGHGKLCLYHRNKVQQLSNVANGVVNMIILFHQKLSPTFKITPVFVPVLHKNSTDIMSNRKETVMVLFTITNLSTRTYLEKDDFSVHRKKVRRPKKI